MDQAHLSPEQMAERLGVSGMTLRRWRQASNSTAIPKLYERMLVGVVSDLMAEGLLPLDSKAAKSAIEHSTYEPVATKSFLGVTADMLKGDHLTSSRFVECISKIGEDPSRKSQVDKNKDKIFLFQKISEEWHLRIRSLWTVLRSEELHSFDKLVAYGAFFYLLMPFDLIPDHIPVIGFTDDFMVLGLAVAYYLKRFPHLFNKP